MDKDYIVLKHEQLEAEKLERQAEELKDVHSEIDQKLADINRKLGSVDAEPGAQSNSLRDHDSKEHTQIKPVALKTYEEIYNEAYGLLIERGLDPDDISYGDLLSEREIREIEHELNALLPREEKWVKNDFIAVFVAALIGSAGDFIFGNRNNPLTGEGSSFAKELNERFHNHAPNAPIDYQGDGFGGPKHRIKSKGHDILRFLEGIEQFRNGTFEGSYHLGHGKIVEAVAYANQYGTPYEQLSTINALTTYAKHMFGDLFSSYSLPFPGYSFIMDSDNRRLRLLTLDMYGRGFNCKNIIIQSISTISIEIIIRIYYGINSIQKMKMDIEVDEDFSAFDEIKELFLPQKNEKLMEMLLLSHSIVTAVNIGKISITKRVEQINITEIMAVVRYGISVLKATWSRNDEYGKLMRNADLISQGWEKLSIEIFDKELLDELETREPLLID